MANLRPESTQVSDRPDIIYIVTDQQRYDSLGCCGSPLGVTPNLDALAETGMTFDRCISAHAVCMPSRATMLTGLYPSTHGVWANGVALPRRGYTPAPETTSILRSDHPAHGTIPSHAETIADVLAAAGYDTTAVGKLHLTPTGARPELGYEESTARWAEDPAMADWHGPYYGFQHVELTLGHGERCGGHFGHWLEREHPEAVESRRRAVEGPRPTSRKDVYRGGLPIEAHPTTWIADRACEAIRQRSDHDNPMFLWVGIPDPHHPFTPPAELAGRFEKLEVPPPVAPDCSGKPSPYRYVDREKGGMRIPGEAVPLIRQYTAAMVHLIDQAVGQIMMTLRETGRLDRTILVFTSDHGDFLGDFGLCYKFPLADRTLNHVPLLMRGPGLDPGRVAEPVSHVDLMPTLCHFAGTSPPFNRGQPLHTIAGRGRDPRFPVLTQHYGHGDDPHQVNFTIHAEGHRFTWYPVDDVRELYDHSADPCELNNLAGQRKTATLERELMTRLLEAHARCDSRNSNRVALW